VVIDMAENKAYTEAFSTGKYDRESGLLGKYDNVRRYWEDQITGIFLRPYLNVLVEYKKERMERVRILDLGCGSGDGYDFLMNVTTKDPGLYEYITAALTPEVLQAYVGLDINGDLLQQAESCYGHLPKVSFIRGDLSDGLPEVATELQPFDVYFTSFGTLSHFNEQQSIGIIADICRHAADRALFIGDWLGRYSYEWQELWSHSIEEEYFMDYRISYIYPEEQRQDRNVSSFPLRLMSRDEIRRIIAAAAERAQIKLKPLAFFDRSILIGRHMDTAEYNPYCPKIRSAVNSLFEGYVRTDLESLLIDHVPRKGFDHLNSFFEMFFMSCNTLVRHTAALLESFDPKTGRVRAAPEVPAYYPEPLKAAMDAMRRVIEGIGWVPWGDVRANVIEPYLGFSLRKLEAELQPGSGVGHGLVGIFEISK